MNKQISPKERGLIKGALRRVFSRSELRRLVLDEAIIEHTDITRPRVTKWVLCAECNQPTPKYKAVVDHKVPVVPTDKSLEELSWDQVIDSMWCDKNNLQVLDQTCHSKKTKLENKTRREYKKGKKK